MTNKLKKAMSDPNGLWWSSRDPHLCKAAGYSVPIRETDDVFAEPVPMPGSPRGLEDLPILGAPMTTHAVVGGPWEFYREFRRKHGLGNLPVSAGPEIAVKPERSFTVPIHVAASGACARSFHAERQHSGRVESNSRCREVFPGTGDGCVVSSGGSNTGALEGAIEGATPEMIVFMLAKGKSQLAT